MKIALVMVHGRVHQYVGGAPRVFFDMANHLSEIGHEIIAIYNDGRGGAPFYQASEKILLHNLALPQKLPGIGKYKLLRELLRGLAKLPIVDIRFNPVTQQVQKSAGVVMNPLLNDFQPDVVIAYHVSDLVSLAGADWQARKTIVMCHTDPQRVYLGLADYERAIWQRADVIQVLLTSYKQYLSPLVDTRVEVIGNIVMEQLQVSSLTAHQIVYLARIEKNKRQHLIIEAMHKIPKAVRGDWKVVLYGSCNGGAYLDSLNAMIETYHLEDTVELRGVTREPFDILRQSSICAFPSAFEGFPLALTESMSVCLPCVGFQSCSGVNELIVDQDNGYLVDDVESFANQLQVLMKDKQQREVIGMRARESMKNYSQASIWRQWEKLISE